MGEAFPAMMNSSCFARRFTPTALTHAGLLPNGIRFPLKPYVYTCSTLVNNFFVPRLDSVNWEGSDTETHLGEWIVSFWTLELTAVMPDPTRITDTAVQDISVPYRRVLDVWSDQNPAVPT